MNATPDSNPVSFTRTASLFWKPVKERIGFFSLFIFLIALANTANTLAPLFYKNFFDVISQGKNLSSVAAQIALFSLVGAFTLKFLRWASYRGADYIGNPVAAGSMKDLLTDGYNALIPHSYKFFSDSFVGTLTRRVTRFSYAFESVFNITTYQLVPLIVADVVIFYVVYGRSPVVAAVLFGWIVFMFILQFFVFRWKQKYELQRTEVDSKMSGALSDGITNNSTIKLFSGFNHEARLVEAVAEQVKQLRLLTWNIDVVVAAILGFLTITIEIVVMLSAFSLYRKGLLTLGDFVLFQTYIITMTEQAWQFGRMMKNLFISFAEAKEMVEIIDQPYDVQDVPGAGELVVKKGAIEFKDIVFNFNETRTVLDGFNLSIAPGEKIAFVGSSGAGKSTLTKLLFRFYDVTGGMITVDGQDVSKVTQESLRNAISLVPQEPILFHRTLRENIAYGRRDATDEEIIAAATKAHCHDFITALPDGYETLVGERGVKLSGGERQRVAIARAILKDAPILVLDEATSSLDSESEMLIQDALKTLMEGKTVIVIAHRLSTINTMDRIIVVENGKVRAAGSHTELLKTDDVYKKLWDIQAGGFIGEE